MMSFENELSNLDATAQAELVRKKEVLPIELIEAAIELIEKINPKINAVVTKMYDEARAAANAEPGATPFAGVPFFLKDLLAAYKGVPTTSGSRYLRGFTPNQDSELVSRYKRAGLIILGKTNTPEFGILPTTEPELFGAARNPWNTEHTTGGSSGGSAAAVAAGIVPMAHANDGGGSIRIPASCCGVFGLKPTRARIPLGPNYGDIYSGMVVEHAVTRTVRDSARLLDATSGSMLGDPYCVPAPARPFIEEVRTDPGKLRIAFFNEAPLGTPIHEDCVAAVENAAKLLVDLGHEVADTAPPINGEMMWKSFMAIWAAGVTWPIQNASYIIGRMPDEGELEPLTNALNETGKKVSASDYLLSVQYFQMLTRQIAEFMQDYDLLLTPTLGSPPLKLGSFAPAPEDAMAGMHVATEFVPFTPICNATGQPAMSVPLYWNAEGLPIGTHFIGRYGDEATLFRLASQLEQARPWANRHPAVSV
jgi:amidase